MMNQLKYWKALLLLCGTLVLISCSSGQTGDTPAATTTAAPTASAPRVGAANLPPLLMQQAWGQVQVSQLSLDQGDRYFVPDAQHNGLTDDDQLCGSTSSTQSQPGSGLQAIASVGLLDLRTGHVTMLVTMPTGYSLIACTVTGPWVIWSQTSGDILKNPATPWTLKALNRRTGEVRQLDQGPLPTGQHPPVSIRPEPYASNGRVAWTTYSATTPGATQSEMYTFATSAKTVLADQTSGPLISWPWVSWGDGVSRAIVFENLVTMQQVRLPMQYPPTTVAFAGTTFVYTNSDYSQVMGVPSILAQPISPSVIEDKQTDGSDFEEFPTLNARLIAWVAPNGWLVFDRKLQRPVKIPLGVHGFEGFVCGHYLVASPPLTDADAQAQHQGLPYHHVMQVIDTNTLP